MITSTLRKRSLTLPMNLFCCGNSLRTRRIKKHNTSLTISAPVPIPATPAPTPAPPTDSNCSYCCSIGGNGCPSWDNGCFTAEKCGKTADCMWDSQEWVLECEDDGGSGGDGGGGCCALNGSCPSWNHACFEYSKCGIDDPSTGTWCSWNGQLSWQGSP